MKHCGNCKNLNVVEEEGYYWCRSCGWTSDGRETPRLAAQPNRR